MILLVLCLFYLLTISGEPTDAKTLRNVGICYGRLGDNLPSFSESIQLIKSMNASGVKIYDANPDLLHLLSDSELRVSIMVPNGDIRRIASNQSLADEWVERHVIPFHPRTRIESILVGNEILSDSTEQGKQVWHALVPAMERISSSLKTRGGRSARGIRVGTPLAMDMVVSTFPPSSGAFRSDVRDSVMAPLLNFLNRTGSHFFLDVYTYFPWSSDPSHIDLDYALLVEQENVNYTDPESGLTYTNLLDQMLDSVYFAMGKLGYHRVKLAIAETGWPNGDGGDVFGANSFNAGTYNRNVIKRVTSDPPIGTPARPGEAITSYLFALYDENQKPGPDVERHWGMLSPSGSPHYVLDLTGDLYRPEIPLDP
uniref:glucan endo-1,3-beta-D-glucosidase n=1 Tax=Kalanchoe fedtschenkoi TaxID=63787 RepID=A0A7N0RH34_KALFE